MPNWWVLETENYIKNITSIKNNQMAKSNSNNILAIVLIGLFLLLGFCAYQWYQIRTLKQELSSTKDNLLQTEKLQAELEQDYQLALDNLEEMRGTNTELNAMIDQQKAELSNQKKKITNLLWTRGELGKAKEEMEILRNQAASYAAQIRDLKTQNIELSSANSTLKLAKAELESEVETQTATIADLDEKTTQLTEIKQQIEEENSTLSSKVDMAEAIKINFIGVSGVKEKSGKETMRAKASDQLKACFKTESNHVVNAGDEMFYIRIINPGGETLFDQNLGSGTLSSKLDGSDVRYTTTSSIAYNNEDAEGCVVYDPGFELGKGNYNVEIYNKGYRVGNGNFILK